MPDRIVRYILSGDSRGAVRAMEDTAVASEKTGKAVQRSGSQVESSLAKTEKGAKRVHGAIGGLLGNVGLAGMAFGITDVVKAGVGWQQQQAQLRQSLLDTGQMASGTIREINKAIDESSTHGGFDAQQETAGVSQLVRLTHSATKAMDLNREAVMLARGAHEDYATAVGQVERVQTGQVGRLQKLLGIIIPARKSTQALSADYQQQVQAIKAATAGNKLLQQEQLAAAKRDYQQALIRAQEHDKEATAAAANAAILRKFGGATEAYSRTAAGSLSNASNSFHLLSEEIGRGVLPELTAVATWMGRNRTVVFALAGSIAALVVVIEAVKLVTSAWTAATKIATAAEAVWSAVTEGASAAMWLLNIAMDANPIGVVVLAIGALVAIVVLVTGHFKDFEHIVSGIWNWLKGAVVDVVHFVGSHWKLLAVILAGPLAPIVLLITHLHDVIRLVKEATSLPGKALHGVTGAISSVGHFLGLRTGGLVPVYAAGGTFLSRGSDTVPAMLTPGEMVFRRAAVEAIGAGTLQQMNATGQIPAPDMPPLMIDNKIVIDGRVIAEAVTHYISKMAARR